MSAATIIAMIQQGLVLLPQFVGWYNTIKADFSTDDQTAIDAALADAQAKDAKDTAQADADLDAAAQS